MYVFQLLPSDVKLFYAFMSVYLYIKNITMLTPIIKIVYLEVIALLIIIGIFGNFGFLSLEKL